MEHNKAAEIFKEKKKANERAASKLFCPILRRGKVVNGFDLYLTRGQLKKTYMRSCGSYY